jgi:hypothetical protein
MQAKFLCTVCIRRISRRDLGSHRVLLHGHIHLWRLEGGLSLLLFHAGYFCIKKFFGGGAMQSKSAGKSGGGRGAPAARAYP